jgi:hypothetical protein
MGILGSDSGIVGGEGVTLQQVAGVESDDLTGIAASEGVDHDRDAGESTGKGLILEIVPRGGVPVHVGRGDEYDVGAVLDLGGSDTESEEQGEHRHPIYTLAHIRLAVYSLRRI